MPRTADIQTAFIAVADPFTPPSASIIETPEGYDVIDNASAFNRGDTLLNWI